MPSCALQTLCCVSLAVKCLKNTPAFFAERLNKAMRVCSSCMQGSGKGWGGSGVVVQDILKPPGSEGSTVG